MNKCSFCNKPLKKHKKNQDLCYSCGLALRKNNLKAIIDIYLERKSRDNLRNLGGKTR